MTKLNTISTGIEIAITGISCKFPGSDNYKEYWENLRNAKESIHFFTREELACLGVSEDLLLDPAYVGAAGVVRDKERFDHAFFGYTADEARLMDPQIRLFHEHCWAALEDAGQAGLIDRRKVAIFAGAVSNDAWKLHAYGQSADAGVDPFLLKRLIASTHVSSLVAYKLNLRGGAYFVDTACSTSLTAVHLACRSLLLRECSVALAGGVSLHSLRQKGYLYREGMVNSSDGHCRSFDSQASGTVFGEGVGVVVLRRLSDALRDGDHIYCVVRSSAVDNDGSEKVGYTAPGVKGQADCISAALKLGGVDPVSIGYVEAHGTATRLGDVVEISALNVAFGKREGVECAIGSVKTNIGHLDTAAGVAGLIKAALCLYHRQLPPSLHFRNANPDIDFGGGPFRVHAELTDWQNADGSPLRAAVSSLGIGGTNAFAVLEEAPVASHTDDSEGWKLMLFSAKTESALNRYIREFAGVVAADGELDLSQAAYTLQTGRRHFPVRRAIIIKDKTELIRLAEAQDGKGAGKPAYPEPTVVFAFPGVGSQYAGMGKDLYEHIPAFRQEMDKGFAQLERITGIDYRSIFFPLSLEDPRINEIRYTQPAIFLFGHSLARMLMSWGIKPDYMIGHSLGEYIAATIAGVFSFEDALRLVVKRGELLQRLEEGAMLSVAIGRADALQWLDEGISLAAVNADRQVVFSGSCPAIESLAVKLDYAGVGYSRLHTNRAMHSAMLDGILAEFRLTVDKTPAGIGRIPFISNLTGTFITETEVGTAGYWVTHLRETVEFLAGIKKLLSITRNPVVIEIGASNTLTKLFNQHRSAEGGPFGVSLVRHPNVSTDDREFFIKSLGELWSVGVDIDWNAYHPVARTKVSLPTYSFEPSRFPAEVDIRNEAYDLPRVAFSGEGKKRVEEFLYTAGWRSADLPRKATDKGKAGCLVFSPGDIDFRQALLRQLMEQKRELVEVGWGPIFEEVGVGKYVLDPTRPEHFTTLFTELRNRRFPMGEILYCWPCDTDVSNIALKDENCELNLNFFSLVYLTRELMRRQSAGGIRIVIVTRHLYSVLGSEVLNYGQSLSVGLMHTISQESGIRCLNIDLAQAGNAGDHAIELIRELSYERQPQDRVLALRHGKRWIPNYQQNPSLPSSMSGVLKMGGVYVITGGLGKLGFVLARHLVERYHAKVFLIGRRSLSFKPKAEDFVAGSEWRKRLEFLAANIDNTAYGEADVSVLEDLKRVIQEVEMRFGGINGIIHTAGAVDIQESELIEDISVSKTMSIFKPKIAGLSNLYDVSKGRNIDFVWVASSLSAILGGVSFGAYSAANLFMDSFILSKTRELSNWISVDMPGLELDGSDQNGRGGKKRLLPNDIIQLFEASLAMEGQQVAIASPENLSSRITEAYSAGGLKFSGEDAATRESSPLLGRLADRPYQPPETAEEEVLIGMIETCLGVARVGMGDNFFEAGGDSLKAMVLLKRVQSEFNVVMELKDFFGYKTIREFLDHVREKRWLESEADKKFDIIL